jgi:mannosyltransferase
VERDIGSTSTIISHGVDLNRFKPPADRALAWAALGLGGQFGVGVVGRIRENKGQGDFVAAVAPLLQVYPDWRAVLIGLAQGSDRAWAEGLRELTRNSLILPGEQRDVERWYQGFTVVVQPSYREAYSLVTLEALAAGCCVVATNIESHPDLIRHGENGFLYEPGDIATLKLILESLLKNPELAMRVGANAAEEARQRFGIDHEANNLVSVYRSLLTES